MLLLGGPFTASSAISIAPRGVRREEARLTLPGLQPSAGSIKIVVPAGLGAQQQWEVRVDGSAAYTLNAPQPWWASGDSRRHATPGGYVRMFGSCVHMTSAAIKRAETELAAAKADVTAALDAGSVSYTHLTLPTICSV